MPNDSSDKNQHQIELTKVGQQELLAELEELKTIKLPQVIDRVSTAREHGDLSENAEYHSAKEEQQLVETRIDEIETILNKSVVVKSTTGSTKVGVGSKIIISKVGQQAKRTLTIVGDFESEPGEGKVSISSPLGKALSGKKKNDIVKVKAPSGEVEYEIIDIK